MGTNKLGFWSIVLLGINGIIGSGIFLLPNKAVGLIGPASLLVMIFDMLLVLAITFCFAEASGLSRTTAARISTRRKRSATSSAMRWASSRG